MIFPIVTTSMLFSIAPIDNPGTKKYAVVNVAMFATQCSNPEITNPEIQITIIRNLLVSSLHLIPHATARQTKKLHRTALKNI